jgi:hypothetical protein
MLPATRTPIDGKQDEISLAVSVNMPIEADQCRQEMAEDTDINVFLTRYGMPQPGGGSYGEADYDLDLQGALHAIDDSKRAWANLDPELRKKFPSWLDLLAAAEAGELEMTKPSPATAPAQKPTEPNHPEGSEKPEPTDKGTEPKAKK